MIGVDIIDLSCSFSQSKYSLLDYKNRILNKVEYWFCDSFIDLDIIWAIKESSYKCYFKQTNNLFFNPKRILITSLDREKNIFSVQIDDHCYRGYFEINEKFIYAISFDREDRGEGVKVFIPPSNTASISEEFEFFFKAEPKLNAVTMHSCGFPSLFHQGSQAHSYSRSHHGAYYISVLLANSYN